jgi:hypothetical protein
VIAHPAYIPFLDPLHCVHDWWYLLLIPLSFGVSVIYKALRMGNLDDFWRQVAIMTTQVVVAMIGLGIGLLVLVQLVIPIVPLR